MPTEIDRDSKTPPYRQAAADIIARIRAGRYQAGERLPAIPDVMHEYGIARRTAAKALRAVADAGFAELSDGMGYYVLARAPGHGVAHDADTTRNAAK